MLPPSLSVKPPGLGATEPPRITCSKEMEEQYATLVRTLAAIPDTAFTPEEVPRTYQMTTSTINMVNAYLRKKEILAGNQAQPGNSPGYRVRQKQRFSGMNANIDQLNRNFMCSYYAEQCASMRVQSEDEFLRYMAKQLGGTQEKLKRRLPRLLEVTKGQVLLGDFIAEAAKMSFADNGALITNLKDMLQPDSVVFPLILEMPEAMQSRWCSQIIPFMHAFFLKHQDMSWILNLSDLTFPRVILSAFHPIIVEFVLFSIQNSTPEATAIQQQLVAALRSLTLEQCASLHAQMCVYALLQRLQMVISTSAKRLAEELASLWLAQSAQIGAGSACTFIETRDLRALASTICKR